MSKSKSAIHDFFRCYRPKNETHELAIAQFCAQRRFVVSIDATPDKRLPVTYEEFRQWFETDTPRRGDVVNLVGQGISGIVETVGVNPGACTSRSEVMNWTLLPDVSTIPRWKSPTRRRFSACNGLFTGKGWSGTGGATDSDRAKHPKRMSSTKSAYWVRKSVTVCFGKSMPRDGLSCTV